MNENNNTPINPEQNDNVPANSQNNDQVMPDASSPEDIKAFKWDYTEQDVAKDASDQTSENETSDEGELIDSPETAPKNQADDTVKEEIEQPKAEKTEEKAATQPRKKKNTAPHLSCVLSACSIVLLLAFAFSVMTGLFPIESSYTPSTNNTPTSPETEADPSLIEDFLNSVVVVKGTGVSSISTGTGVIISTDGYIITNYHVIENCSVVTVELYGEKAAEKAEIIGYREDDDVAVLKIKRSGLRPATFVDSTAVRYGEKVYAIGTPEGDDYSWSVTQGIVSCPDRQLMIYDDEGVLEKKMNVVQTDASVNHGNSGGPLINVRGEVVGIVTLKRSDSAGMGFALPSNGVLIDAQAIIKNGHADNVSSGISMPRPLIGVTGVGVVKDTYYESFSDEDGSGVNVVDEAYAKKNPDTTFYAEITGVYVSATSAGSDAAKALKKGDIITEINGNPVATIYQVMGIINEYNGGDSVTVEYYRNGNYYSAELTLRSAND